MRSSCGAVETIRYASPTRTKDRHSTPHSSPSSGIALDDPERHRAIQIDLDTTARAVIVLCEWAHWRFGGWKPKLDGGSGGEIGGCPTAQTGWRFWRRRADRMVVEKVAEWMADPVVVMVADWGGLWSQPIMEADLLPLLLAIREYIDSLPAKLSVTTAGVRDRSCSGHSIHRLCLAI